MPERHVCTQRYTLQLNSVPDIETILITALWLGLNGSSKNRDSKNRDCTVQSINRNIIILTL